MVSISSYRHLVCRSAADKVGMTADHAIGVVNKGVYAVRSNVEGGRAYGLSFHLDRLIGSAAKAEIEHVPWSKDELRYFSCSELIR